MTATRLLALATLTALGISSASAHIGYTGRNFGSFLADGSDLPVTINAQTISGLFGWADATDADYGDSHRTRAFRFTLLNPGTVSLQVAGVTGVFPGFSIYGGLAHISPINADHDPAVISQTYLTGLGTGPKEGSLNALGDWAIGNDPGYVIPGDSTSGYAYNIPGDPLSGYAVPPTLSYFTYYGHAADGTFDNYGSAAGINGDGIADNFVSGTFNLPAGDYSIFIGGADYALQAPGPYTTYGITPTLTVVPEPTSTLLLVLGALGLAARRRA